MEEMSSERLQRDRSHEALERAMGSQGVFEKMRGVI